MNTKSDLDIFEEGYEQGYNDELPRCPYEEGTHECEVWFEGYDQGSQDC